MEQTAAVSYKSIFTVFRCYLLVITKVVGRAALLRLLATYSLPPGPEPRLCQCPVSGDQRRPHTWSPRHGRTEPQCRDRPPMFPKVRAEERGRYRDVDTGLVTLVTLVTRVTRVTLFTRVTMFTMEASCPPSPCHSSAPRPEAPVPSRLQPL